MSSEPKLVGQKGVTLSVRGEATRVVVQRDRPPFLGGLHVGSMRANLGPPSSYLNDADRPLSIVLAFQPVRPTRFCRGRRRPGRGRLGAEIPSL